jgi:hypothetical protein
LAVTAAAGIVGWAPQYEMGDTTVTWYKHKATQIDLAVLDDTRLGDDEVGGRPVPTFPYKAGVMVGGGVTLQPRLEDTLGWLLYGMMGKCTSTVVETSSAYDHAFTFDTDAGAVRWMSFRKYIPRKDGGTATDLGEIYRDCKVLGSSMTLASDRPVQMRMDVLGRTFELDHAADTWTWDNASFENYPSIPIGCHTSGSISIGGTSLPVVQATINFANQPLDTRMERVIGSPYLEDVTIVKRQLSFDLLVKWNNPDLYASILTGETTGTAWTAEPFTGAFEVVTSAYGEADTGYPYTLTIGCTDAMLALNGGITLAGGQAVMMRFNGVALDPTSGEYTTITLRNAETTYAWPSS